MYRHARDLPSSARLTAVRPPAVHPSLARAFAVLSASGARWCILRGWDRLDVPPDDVDLLVDSESLDRVTRELEGLGYVRLPSWGRGRHRFFLTYDRDHDVWVKLDIVDRVAFGPGGVHETGLERVLLERRVSTDPVPHLAAADEFWALLLHCLLDRGTVEPVHADTLARLAGDAGPPAPLADWLVGVARDERPVAILEAAGRRDVESLHALGQRLRASISPSIELAFRRWSRAAMRRMTKVRRALLERGLSIALLGVDGAGKSTVAAALASRLPWEVRTVYLGLYGAGPGGAAPRGAMGRLGRLWAGYARGIGHRTRGRMVIYDRFGWDALLMSPSRRGRGARVRRWVLAHAVPPPDLVVLLDAPPTVAHARKPEHDLEELSRQRDQYLDLASKRPEIVVVRTDQDMNAVVRAITAAIWQRALARRQRRRA